MILSICYPIINRHFFIEKSRGPGVCSESSDAVTNTTSLCGVKQRTKYGYSTEQPGCRYCDTIIALRGCTEMEIVVAKTYQHINSAFHLQDESRQRIYERNSGPNNTLSSGAPITYHNLDHSSQETNRQNEKVINDAKYIYLCVMSLSSISTDINWILSKIIGKKIVFNLSDGFLTSFIDVNLLKKIWNKSKIIIGNVEDFECVRFRMYYGQYESVENMITDQAQQDKIIISIHKNGKVYWVSKNRKGRINMRVDAKGFYSVSKLGDYILAGFMSVFYNNDKNLTKCIKKGRKLAKEHNKGYKKGINY